MHKNGNNANIGIRGFISWKQKIQLQNATLVSIEPLDLWFQVQHAPLYTNSRGCSVVDRRRGKWSHINDKNKLHKEYIVIFSESMFVWLRH